MDSDLEVSSEVMENYISNHFKTNFETGKIHLKDFEKFKSLPTKPI